LVPSFLIVTIIAICFVRKGRKWASQVSVSNSQLSFEGNADKIDLNADPKYQVQPYNTKREIKRSTFELKDEIGSGNFGKVNKGLLTGLYTDSSETTVAIKSINDLGHEQNLCSKLQNEQNLNDLLCEIKLMGRIKPHPNLVSMIGSCSSELEKHGELWLLIEFCEHGDLQSYLQNNKKTIAHGKESDQMNSRCLLKWSHGIAKGMRYLEQNHIMHGDLAARNILMSEDPLKSECHLAKIADFGLAKNFYGNITYEKKSRLMVPWKWMAIEYLKNDFFTLKSDVWSYGVLLWEILSFGGNPYGHQDHDEVMEKLDSGYRLPCPKDTALCTSWSPVSLYNKLSEVCFLRDPKERAAFSDVVKILEHYLSSNEKEYYEQISDVYDRIRAAKYLKMGNVGTPQK